MVMFFGFLWIFSFVFVLKYPEIPKIPCFLPSVRFTVSSFRRPNFPTHPPLQVICNVVVRVGSTYDANRDVIV